MAGHGFEVITAGLLSASVAQLTKVFLHLFARKPFNFRLLVETGGMPSTHTASMMGLSTATGLVAGFDSVEYAIALGVTLVVMYDAAGVRRAAGRMAGILNQITRDVYSHHPDKLPERLRELLGHTPVEVMGGAIVGAGIALLMHHYVF
ncbi:MAG: divergent PAP2 family protein [Vampirovibrionales bacterium]|nr:divergent PAP2 family protein [Vampirovibrionales bacterium]